MPDLGPHAAFILAAYGVTAVAVTALIVFVVSDDRRQQRLLAELERQGITRRSAKPVAAKLEPTKSPQAAKPKRRTKKPKS